MNTIMNRLSYILLICIALCSCGQNKLDFCSEDLVFEPYTNDITNTDYSVYSHILSKTNPETQIYIRQVTISLQFPLYLIKYQYDSIDDIYESYSVYNNPEITNPTSYLNENKFNEFANTCVLPDNEYFQLDLIPDIEQLTFTRIGYNADSSEAFISLKDRQGYFNMYLKLVENNWEVEWISALLDN